MELRKRKHTPDSSEGRTSPSLLAMTGVDSPALSSISTATTQSSDQESVGSVSWASNNKYRLLSTFMSWVNKSVFYPIPNVMEVTLRVVVLESESVSECGPQECSACKKCLSESEILDRVAAVNWSVIDTFNLRSIDRRLHLLATSVRGAVRLFLQWSDSGLYNADDRAGVVVKLKVGTKIDTDADTSAETSTNTEPTDSDGKDDENKDGDACSTIDAVEMRGAPDLSVLIEDKPHIFVILTENKKYMSRQNTLRLMGWRETHDSQIGQLLYYLLAVQLRRIQLFLSPSSRENQYGPPTPVLGLFMAEGMFGPVVAGVENVSGGSWTIQLHIGKQPI